MWMRLEFPRRVELASGFLDSKLATWPTQFYNWTIYWGAAPEKTPLNSPIELINFGSPTAKNKYKINSKTEYLFNTKHIKSHGFII